MSEVFTAFYQAISFAASKNMAAIQNFNNEKVIKILRIGLNNLQYNALSGSLNFLEVRVYQSSDANLLSPVSINIFPHDLANNYYGDIICSHTGTISGTNSVLRRIFWSSDEISSSSAMTNDELETVIPLNIIYDSGYGDSNVQPLTLRNGELLSIFNTTGATGTVDIFIEFEVE